MYHKLEQIFDVVIPKAYIRHFTTFSKWFTTDIIRYCRKSPNEWFVGTDSIPCCVVRNCAEVFSIPLTIIIQSSIMHGIFLEVWEQAKVCSIPKTGNLSDVALSRPISVLCSFSKVLEMYIYKLVFNEFQSIVSISAWLYA